MRSYGQNTGRRLTISGADGLAVAEVRVLALDSKMLVYPTYVREYRTGFSRGLANARLGALPVAQAAI